jgi:hypothetical protein
MSTWRLSGWRHGQLSISTIRRTGRLLAPSLCLLASDADRPVGKHTCLPSAADL